MTLAVGDAELEVGPLYAIDDLAGLQVLLGFRQSPFCLLQLDLSLLLLDG